MFDDRLAEGDALFGVFYRFVDSPLGNADGQGCNHRPGQVQGLHGVDEALPFFTDEVVCRDVDVLENDFCRVGQADAHFIFFFADRNARAVPFDDEG